MKTIKFAQILFSIAVITALALALFPVTSAHAMSAGGASTAISSGEFGGAGALVGTSGVVCRSKHVRHNGHWVTIRVCHRVDKPD